MQYKIFILSLLFVSLSARVSAETPSPHANEKIEITTSPMDNACPADSKIPKITLVLGGGGCKSLAQIGVLKVLRKIIFRYITLSAQVLERSLELFMRLMCHWQILSNWLLMVNYKVQ